MSQASPLRYPGGKSVMAPLLSDIRKLNGLGQTSVAEPFAGGAGASLALLYNEETPEIYINDFDPAIHDLWWNLVERPGPFLKLLSGTRVSMAEWQRQREVYRAGPAVSRLRRGFSAFYLNRCNRSGIIINGGPIGGVQQLGEWKLNARFNKVELKQRCRKVGEYRDRISVSGIDGLEFIRRRGNEQTMFVIDPPYFHKGEALYLNTLDANYHRGLASALQEQGAAWVLTYDDCQEIRELYEGWASVRAFTLRYSAHKRGLGKELFITPKWMELPRSQRSAALGW